MERNDGAANHLLNDVVHHFSWNNVTVTVKDRKTRQTTPILQNASGMLYAGEMLAIMGPSGSGKTTLLNTLALRDASAGATTTGRIMANGHDLNVDASRKLSTYVEQEDVLIGSVTVRETMRFAAGLALPSRTSRREKNRRVDSLIAAFGLQQQADTIVGTPIQKGLSGGQKKRLGVASRLITEPKILFLDEPTSSLDSTISFEVMSFIKEIARKNKLLVIASMQQPSTSTFNLFDRLCLLSKGETCYFGALDGAHRHLSQIGYLMPQNTNPAEFYLDLINTDLAHEGDETHLRQRHIITQWASSTANEQLTNAIREIKGTALPGSQLQASPDITVERPAFWKVCQVLLHRLWIKAYRDVTTYTIRVVMYIGLAVLMATVFLRFKSSQEYIQPYINAIFFGSAFMSFMAVAYVPAFIEDQINFARERANGLVGPFAFLLTNFLIGLPYLFLTSMLFSLITYFLIDFRMSGVAFFRFVGWLFLDLLAAESLVVLVASIQPIFVVALAVTAFANGLWMCTGGFLVPLSVLNPFWKYAFHYVNYQAYVFQGMMVNEFEHRVYACDTTGTTPHRTFHCSYPSELQAQGKIAGSAVLHALKIPLHQEGEWVAIMIAIIFVQRLLAYAILWLRK